MSAIRPLIALLPLLLLDCGTTHHNHLHRDFPDPPGYQRSQKTLAEKADHYEKNLRHFITKDGLLVYYRHGKFDGPPKRGHYGRLADGPIWQGCLLAAEAFRYGVTKDKAALARVKKLIQGLRNLQRVTGQPGFLARFYDIAPIPEKDRTDHGRWWKGRGKGYEKFRYRGDVSKDQYSGVIFGYTAAYLLVDAPDVREIIRKDVLAIADHLIENDFRLVHPTAGITPFGNMHGRIAGAPIGVNALISLSAIALACHISGDAPKYRRTWNNLIRWKWHKIASLARANILGINNPNNDNMALLGAGSLLMLLEPGEPRQYIEKSVKTIWSFVKAEGNAFWTHLYAAHISRPRQALRDAKRNLELFPETLVDFSCDNRNLPGVEAYFLDGRKGRAQAKHALPLNRRGLSSFIWKSDPYTLVVKGRKDTAYTGTDYLLAYWMGRYYGFLGAGE